jgi:hypothetical protein
VAEAGAVAESAAPQWPQKRFPDGFSAPHAGQIRGRGEPQSPQNRLPVGFDWPQVGQVTVACSIVPSSYTSLDRAQEALLTARRRW